MKARRGEGLAGNHASAVEVLIEAEPGDRPDWSATLAVWFLHCPGQSPAWDDYLLSVIHLRPIEGQAHPPEIRVPGATHEVMVYAADPDLHPTPEDVESWLPLRPINVMEQVQLPDDDAAITLAHDCAEAVVRGILWAEPPLSGQVEPWRTALIKTSAHARGEPHAP